MRKYTDEGKINREGLRLLELNSRITRMARERFPGIDPQEILDSMDWLTQSVERGELEVPEDYEDLYEAIDLSGIPPEVGDIDIRKDGSVIIVWHSRLVITMLDQVDDEVDVFACPIIVHGMIQRAYSNLYEGGGETVRALATRFDFKTRGHAQRYLKIHEITHDSVPQSQIEIEWAVREGKDLEELAEEWSEDNVRSMQRWIAKRTEVKKEREIREAAQKWWHQESAYTDLVETLNSRPPEANLLPAGVWVTEGWSKPRKPFFALAGITDLHYGKAAYDLNGVMTYGRDIAARAALTTGQDLIEQVKVLGRPEEFGIVIGSDNLHIDNEFKTTTRGTPQDVDGEFRAILPGYIDLILAHIDLHKAIAPVRLVVMPGNHDKAVSMMVGHMLERMFEADPRVTVMRKDSERLYWQYGKTGFGFSHGDPEALTSAKRAKNLHKLIMSEAHLHGVNYDDVNHWYYMAGNLHAEATEDYGVVTYEQMPAMCGDDRWHEASSYVGSRKQTAMYVFEPDFGKRVVFYAPFEPELALAA